MNQYSNARSSFIGFIAILTMMAGCSGNDKAPATAAIQTPTTPMVDRLDALQKCSLQAAEKLNVSSGKYLDILVSRGIVEELREDAESIALEEIATLQRIAPPGSDRDRINIYTEAIGEVAWVKARGSEAQLRAKALHAYYESMATGQACPLDQDILQLIKKTKS